MRKLIFFLLAPVFTPLDLVVLGIIGTTFLPALRDAWASHALGHALIVLLIALWVCTVWRVIQWIARMAIGHILKLRP